MKWTNIVLATAIIVTVTNRAESLERNFSPITSGPGFSATTDSYLYPGSIDNYSSSSRYHDRKTRRKLLTGGLMLGIGWAVPAIVGLMVMDAGNTGVGARMMIPYFGFAETAVEVADEFITLAVPLFIPTIVQLVGTGFLIAGAVEKSRRRPRNFSAAPILYREGGGGVGVSFAL